VGVEALLVVTELTHAVDRCLRIEEARGGVAEELLVGRQLQQHGPPLVISHPTARSSRERRSAF